jgi:hypothetical protein
MAAKKRPPLPLIADYATEGVGEGERDREQRPDLEEVRESGRILERVGGVRIDDPAAIRAELFDRLLARDRPAIDLLRGSLQRRHVSAPAH